MVKPESKEYQKVKYVRELTEYFDAYICALIDEVFVGVAINLGMPEADAYKLVKNNPHELKKGFFDNLFAKFRSLFPYKVPKFRVSKSLYNNGKPMTQKQWDIFNKSLSEYWKRHSHKATEDATTKAFYLGKRTTGFKKMGIDYSFKSLEQVNKERKLPTNIGEAFHEATESEKNAMSLAMARVATHVTETGHDLEVAIRKNINKGIEDGKGSRKIASDLFWDVQVASGSTAQKMRKNWNRIAITETQAAYESGILAPYEEEAEESISGDGKPQYFVFHGGSCKWCSAQQGTIVRLIPASVAKGAGTDSLSAMGIHDPVTDIAIWQGKNNVGKYSYKSPHWWVCTPAHPHGVATMEPIDPEREFFNPKTGEIEKKQVDRVKHLPKVKEFKFTKEEREARKPKFIGDNLVSFDDSIYTSVRTQREYDQKQKAWQRDPTQPIPVMVGSTSYGIFEAAEKNK